MHFKQLRIRSYSEWLFEGMNYESDRRLVLGVGPYEEDS